MVDRSIDSVLGGRKLNSVLLDGSVIDDSVLGGGNLVDRTIESVLEDREPDSMLVDRSIDSVLKGIKLDSVLDDGLIDSGCDGIKLDSDG